MRIKFFFLYFIIFNLFAGLNSFSFEEIPSEINLTIKGSQYKDLLKQYTLFTKDDENGLVNPNNIKKNVRSEVIWVDPFNNKINKDLAKIRLTGDYWRDHVNLKENIFSLQVRLNTKNIGGITKFKLFLPSARQYLNEIFATSFYDELDFITPKTKLVKVTVNGKKYFSTFQEQPSKELIERNNLKDGVILEGYEDSYYYNNYFYRKTNPLCCYSKIDNFKFLKNNDLNLKILFNAATLFTNLVYNNPTQSETHVGFLKIDNKDFFAYDLISKFMGAEHGLTLNNRKFYYDAFYNSLTPIYYDGDVSLNFNYEFIDFLNYEKINKIILQKNFKKYFIKKIKTKIHKDYYLEYPKKTETFFLEIEKMLVKLEKKALEYKKNNKLIKSKKTIFSPLKAEVMAMDEFQNLSFLRKEKNNFEICFVSNEKNLNLDCKKLSDKKSIKILKNDKKFVNNFRSGWGFLNFTQLGGHLTEVKKQNEKDKIKVKQFNKEHKVFKNEKLIFEQKYINSLKYMAPFQGELIVKKNKTYVFQSNNFNKDINIKINYDEIINPTEKNFPRIVVLGDFKDIKFVTKGPNLIKKKNINSNRYNDRQLTGCINFIDVNFKTANGNINNMPCEDAINFVRSSGVIENLEINNSGYDALDADFSKIKIENLKVNRSGNDCLDFSSGNYHIIKLDLNFCGDKGVSAGEKSILMMNKGVISNTEIGIASKDLSEITISERLDIKKSNTCYDIYQKKQEFGIGKIGKNSIKLISCYD